MMDKTNISIRDAIHALKTESASPQDIGSQVLAAAAELRYDSELYSTLPTLAYSRKEAGRIRDALAGYRDVDDSNTPLLVKGARREIYEVHFVLDIAQLCLQRGVRLPDVTSFLGEGFDNVSRSVPLSDWQRKKQDVSFQEYKAIVSSLKNNLYKKLNVRL